MVYLLARCSSSYIPGRAKIFHLSDKFRIHAHTYTHARAHMHERTPPDSFISTWPSKATYPISYLK